MLTPVGLQLLSGTNVGHKNGPVILAVRDGPADMRQATYTNGPLIVAA